MSDRRQTRVNDILRRVLDTDHSERESVIKASCEGDPDLEREVRRLLALSSESTEALFAHLGADAAASANAPHDEAPSLVGKVLNDTYEIRSEIGRGGMGVVLEAYHRPLRRIVAMKLLSRSLATPEMIRRFQHEASILAMLQDPRIAKVFEFGVWDTETGRYPFFAMERIEGLPLTEYIERNTPTLDRTIALLSEICEAAHHAHQHGVIHRDLKPANILVDANGRPHLLDFGIARLLQSEHENASVLTLAGEILGTLSYISPEQLSEQRDQLTIGADVYSLGVLCYEAIAGRLPIDCRDLSVFEAADRIRNQEPPPLSQGKKPLPEDLSTIVRKALEKRPGDRYTSAHELAADLRRFLRDEPVHACPPSRIYQIRKFARRYRATVTAAAMIVTLLIVGLVMTSVLYLRADRALTAEAEQRRLAEISERQAVEAVSRAEREAQRARDAEAEAEQTAEELRQVVAFQQSQLADTEPLLMGIELRERLFATQQAALQVRGLDDEAIAADMQKLDEMLAGVNFSSIALETLDEVVFARALETIEEQFGDQPRVKAQLLQTVAETLRMLGLLDRALEPQMQTVEIHRRAFGDEHPETLTAINSMTVLLVDLGRYDDARPLYDEVIASRRRVLGEDHPLTLESLINLGVLIHRQGRYDEAEELQRDALTGLRRVLGDDDPSTLNVMNNLAAVLSDRGKIDEAEQLYRKAWETCRRALGDEHPTTILSLNNLGYIVQKQGRFEEALSLARDAMKNFRRVFGDSHPETLSTINNVGLYYEQLGQYDQAERYYREAYETRQRVLGLHHPDTITSMNSLGVLFFNQQKFEEAETYMRRTLEGYRRLYGDDHRRTLLAVDNLGGLLRGIGRLEEAEPYLTESLAGFRRQLGDDHLDTLISMHNTASLMRDLERFDRAESLSSETVEIAERILPENHWYTAIFLSQHGATLLALDRLDEAKAATTRAYEILQSALGPQHERTRAAVKQLTVICRTLHEREPDAGYELLAAKWQAIHSIDQSPAEPDNETSDEE